MLQESFDGETISIVYSPMLTQVPEGLRKSVPRDFELAAQRKGFLRFRNLALAGLVAALGEAQTAREARLAASLQVHAIHESTTTPCS